MPLSSQTRPLPRTRARAFGAACIFILSTFACDLAWAESPTNEAPALAETLYEAGKAKLKEGDANEALKDFKGALSIAEAQQDLGLTWQLLMAVAYTYREANEPGFAIEYYRRFLDSTELHQAALTAKWRKRRGLAERDIAELEASANASRGYVTVASTPPGAAIFINGEQAGADKDRVTPFGLYLKPGTHRVSVSLEGHEPQEQSVEVAAGKLKPLAFALSRITLEVQAPSPPSVTPSAERPSETTVVSAGVDHDLVLTYGPWAVVGTGGLSLVTGIILSALSESEKADLEASTLDATADGASQKAAYDAWQERSESADAMSAAAIGLYALAGAAIAGGLAWYLWGTPDGAERAAHTLHPILQVSPEGHGVLTGAAWRF